MATSTRLKRAARRAAGACSPAVAVRYPARGPWRLRFSAGGGEGMAVERSGRRRALETLDTGALFRAPGPGALLSVMFYSFARVSAVLGMRRQDYFGPEEPGVAQAPTGRPTTVTVDEIERIVI